MQDGPDLYYLLQRLQNCPGEFLLPPILESSPKTYKGEIYTTAVVNDLLIALGDQPKQLEIEKLFHHKYSEENKNYLQLVLITSYLLYDSWFQSADNLADPIRKVLADGVK
jgi:hypothetical protein